MQRLQPVSLHVVRKHAVSLDLLQRSNSATPAVSSASVYVDGASLGRASDRSLHSRSNSATPAVVIVPVVR